MMAFPPFFSVQMQHHVGSQSLFAQFWHVRVMSNFHVSPKVSNPENCGALYSTLVHSTACCKASMPNAQCMMQQFASHMILYLHHHNIYYSIIIHIVLYTTHDNLPATTTLSSSSLAEQSCFVFIFCSSHQFHYIKVLGLLAQTLVLRCFYKEFYVRRVQGKFSACTHHCHAQATGKMCSHKNLIIYHCFISSLIDGSRQLTSIVLLPRQWMLCISYMGIVEQ